MNLSVVILVLLPMFLDVVYCDENTSGISSVLELFPEFRQMNDRIKKQETSVLALSDRINRLEEGWTLPYKAHFRNYRANSNLMISTALSSGLECWIKCVKTNGCTSASFQSNGGKCELSRVEEVNYFTLQKEVGWDVFTKHTPIVSLHKFNYRLDLAAAKAHCVSLGLSIATLEDLKASYNYGYEDYTCGWAANGVSYRVLQEPQYYWQPSSVGVVECNSSYARSVYCRPLKTDVNVSHHRGDALLREPELFLLTLSLTMDIDAP